MASTDSRTNVPTFQTKKKCPISTLLKNRLYTLRLLCKWCVCRHTNKILNSPWLSCQTIAEKMFFPCFFWWHTKQKQSHTIHTNPCIFWIMMIYSTSIKVFAFMHGNGTPLFWSVLTCNSVLEIQWESLKSFSDMFPALNVEL